MAGKTFTGDTYTDENLKNLETQINQVKDQLNQFNTTAATDDELRKRAQSEYTPIYNAQVAEQQAAKNTAQSTLEGSLNALDRQYARDSEALSRSYDAQAASANNQMLARGFNNSSLAVALGNYVNTQRNRALENLAAERTAAENSARATYNNAITAADAAIGRLGSDLEANIDARLQALRDADQSRVYQQRQAQNALKQYEIELMLQLEQLRRQGLSDYYAMYGTGGSSGSGSSGSGSSGAASTGTTTAATQTSSTPSSSLGDRFNQSNSNKPSNASNVVSGSLVNWANNQSALSKANQSSKAASSGASKLTSALSNMFSKSKK